MNCYHCGMEAHYDLLVWCNGEHLECKDIGMCRDRIMKQSIALQKQLQERAQAPTGSCDHTSCKSVCLLTGLWWGDEEWASTNAHAIWQDFVVKRQEFRVYENEMATALMVIARTMDLRKENDDAG